MRLHTGFAIDADGARHALLSANVPSRAVATLEHLGATIARPTAPAAATRWDSRLADYQRQYRAQVRHGEAEARQAMGQGAA